MNKQEKLIESTIRALQNNLNNTRKSSLQEGYTARENLEDRLAKYKPEKRDAIKVVAETKYYLLTMAKRDDGVINLDVTKGKMDDISMPDVYIKQDYKGLCESAEINWAALGSCTVEKTNKFIECLQDAVEFCKKIEGKNFANDSLKENKKTNINSIYDEVLEFLDVMPNSPFDESEEEIIRDIIKTYPTKSSKEIANIYNEYCETGVY